MIVVEKTAFLLAVDFIVGGVEVKDDFFRGLAMRGNKSANKHGTERNWLCA